MARKKLNKKVAIAGLIILIVFTVIGGIIAWNRFGPKDPSKLLAEARIAMEESNYVEAGQKYGLALAYSKTDDMKVDLLFEIADFHLIDSTDVQKESPSYHEQNWINALQCWGGILNIEPKRTEARRKLLDFYYESADSGNFSAWDRTREHADKLIKIMEEQQSTPDPYLLLARGRAYLQLSEMGQTVNRKETLAKAIADLEEARKLTPKDISVYMYLANAELLSGQMQSLDGILNAKEKAMTKAEQLLTEATVAAPEDAEAVVNLLNMKLNTSLDDKSKIAEIQADYEALPVKFPSSGKAYKALGTYYQLTRKLDEAISAFDKALSLEPENVDYAIQSALLYYRKSSARSDSGALASAVDIAKSGLDLPDAKEISGPRQFANLNNRYRLYSLLATIYIEQALDAEQQDQKESWASKAHEITHEIEQILGNTENVRALKWQGLMSLVEGDTNKAIRQMYSAYLQLINMNQTDQMLSHKLADLFADKPEIGMRRQFLEKAIFIQQNGSAIFTEVVSNKPDILLDYCEVLLTLNEFTGAVAITNIYENYHPATDQSREYRIRGYIGGGRFDLAEEELDKYETTAPIKTELKLAITQGLIKRILTEQAQENSFVAEKATPEQIQKRQAELEKYTREREKIVDELIETSPENIELPILIAVCNNYVTADRKDRAYELISKYLEKTPDNINAYSYKKLLEEDDPQNISIERQNQIHVESIKAVITDPAEQLINLGAYYNTIGDQEKALAAYKEALSHSPGNKTALAAVFDTALNTEDMALAEETAKTAAKLDTDQCQGQYYAARLDLAKEDYKSALAKIDEALKLRPIFPYGYLLRSKINDASGNDDEALKDINAAVSMVPTDGLIARQKAFILFMRVQKSETAVSDDQIREMESALLTAMVLNPNEWKLQRLYADVISDKAPDRALAMLQNIERRYPNVTNSLLLGQMAFKISGKVSDESKKAAYLELSESAFEHAYNMEPENENVLNSYSEFLRDTGQQEKAEQLFASKDNVLWKFYIHDGQYGKALKILEKLHSESPEDTTILTGLVVVANKTKNTDDLKKHLTALIAIEKTVQNELMQIQMYLDNGIDREETKLKLDSFRERYPDHTSGILLQAWLAMNNGQLDEAISLINRSLEIDPDNPTSWRLRGQAHRYKNNIQQAVEDLRKSRELSPNPEIRMELAMAYRQSDNFTAAIGELTEALKADQVPVRVRTLLEEMYIAAGRTEELNKFYAENLKKFPDSDLWYYRAGRFALTEKDYKTAEELLGKAWQLSEKATSDSAILDLYLEAIFRAEKYQQLLKEAAKYIDTEFAPIVYAQMGQAQMKLGNNIRSADYYYKALEKSEKSPSLVLSVLNNMKQSVGTDEVEKWCRKKLASDTNFLPAHITLYSLANESGRYNEAITYVEKCLEILDDKTPAWSDLAIKKANTLIMAYMKTSDKQYLDKAVTHYEIILKAQPNNTGVMNNLAFLLADNDMNLPQAVEYAKKAHEAAPNSANRMDTYSYTMVKNGQFAEAEKLALMSIQYYEKASQDVPWDVYKHLGMAQKGLGKKSEAAISYRRAMQIGGDNISQKDKDDLMKKINETLM